jgi:signal transduction histidine kinase
VTRHRPTGVGRAPRWGHAALPLAVWAGLLGFGSVLGTVVAMGLALLLTDRLDGPALEVLALGTTVGLVLSLALVTAASRLAAALRVLQSDALRRLTEPAAPLASTVSPTTMVRVTSELAELARVLDALHLRVRVADDLGERHRLEAQNAGAGVFELLSGLVAAEEGARGQLAAELHDTVAQSLMIARGLLLEAPTTPEALARLADHVEDAEEQVRAVMARTRPPALREGNLASAVGGLRLDMQARYGLEVQVEWPASPHPLPLAGAVTVYRFFQEALLNVVKHADVDLAALSLRVTETEVLASVRDAGPGFDPDQVRPDRGRHVGLDLLRERARLSGGRLDVQTQSGVGTVLELRLPRVSAPPEAALGSHGADWRTPDRVDAPV